MIHIYKKGKMTPITFYANLKGTLKRKIYEINEEEINSKRKNYKQPKPKSYH